MSKVYISRKIFDAGYDVLRDAGIEYELNEADKPLSSGELAEKVKGVDGLICLLTDKIGEQILQANPDLKIVANVAVGFDNVDVKAATKHGIMVTNTPDVLTQTTADLAFSLLMSAARRIPEADSYTRAGKYEGWELFQPHLGVDVYGKTLGVIGLGRIGYQVAKRALGGFDMEVLYYDAARNTQAEKELGIRYVEFDELLGQSDFVSIHVPLTQQTRGLFDASAFEKMKSNAILVNTSRGAVVDEGALVDAIKKGQILGAGLDVFEEEPKIHPELVKLEKHVVLAPHIGSASHETRRAMSVLAAQNAVAGLTGKRPPTLVNEETFGAK